MLARPMSRSAVLARLRQHERELREAGVGELYLFGSLARDQAHMGSDVDLFIEVDRAQDAHFSLIDLAGVMLQTQEILGCEVDMMTRQGIHPRRRLSIETEAVRVF